MFPSTIIQASTEYIQHPKPEKIIRVQSLDLLLCLKIDHRLLINSPANYRIKGAVPLLLP
jgi:hypothetical protein